MHSHSVTALDLNCFYSSNEPEVHGHIHGNRRDINRIDKVTAFHDEWISAKSAIIKSPFSNRHLSPIKSNCYYIDTYHCILYQYMDTKKFFLIVGDYWFEKIGLYIPKDNMIILHRETTIDLKEMLGVYSLRNLINKSKSLRANCKLSIVLYHDHIAHHIMNELNGIQSLIDNGLIKNIDQIFYCNLPYGNIEEIFHEIPIDKFTKVTREKLNTKITEDNSFILPYQKVKINDKIITRLKLYQRKKLSGESLHEMNVKDQHYNIKLWISIRSGNRILSNKIEILEKIINELKKKGKSVLLIIDGYSEPFELSNREDGQYQKIIAQEKDVIKNLKNIGVDYVDLVGSPIKEVLTWAEVANCYFCHTGTLHHKISWFSDIPGLVHSNEHFSSLPEELLPGMNEKKWINQPMRIPLSYVQDNQTKSRSRNGSILSKKFSNYKLDVNKTKDLFMKILIDNGLINS